MNVHIHNAAKPNFGSVSDQHVIGSSSHSASGREWPSS